MTTKLNPHTIGAATVLLLCLAAPLDGQAVRRTTSPEVARSGFAPGLAVRVPRRPATADVDPIRNPGVVPGHAGTKHFRRTRTFFVPYSTDRAWSGRGAREAEPTESIDALRAEVLEAREAALDAREAALDVRASVLEEAPSDGHDGAPDGVLTWKPGGIRPVSPSEARTPHQPSIFAESRPEMEPRAAAAVPIRLGFVPTAISVPVHLSTVPTCQVRQATQMQQERRRYPWGLGWLARYGREVDVERGAVAAPGFYLRSPLLSGLYRRQDCPDESEPASCATVTLVGDDDAAVAVDVPLPQLAAESPRALRDAIREGLAEDRTIILHTAEGDEFDLMPGAVREIAARPCAPE